MRKSGAAAPARVVGQVRPGIDILEENSFGILKGMRVALLDESDRPDARRALHDRRPEFSEGESRGRDPRSKLFSPEHGIRGALDEKVPDSVDEKTGLPVRSLYGDTPESRRPRPEDLAGLDAVVVDLQDAGCRFYTYLASMGYVLEEAAKAKVKVFVLDRPNPIRADVREGPPADDDALSFVAYHTTPIRTGMTIGELATLYNAEKKARRGPDGREDEGLLARSLVRRDGPHLGEPVAEPPIRDPGGALPGDRPPRDDESLRRARDRIALRGVRRAVDGRRARRRDAERPRHSRACASRR